jgi:large subunit ribosomal protein L20
MPRAKRGFKARRRHNRVLKLAKGFRGGQSKLIRTAIEKVNRAQRFGYTGRRIKKRDYRALWITRIGGAVRELGLNYSQFIRGVKDLGLTINRKMLSEMAIQAPQSFAEIVNQVKGKIASVATK